LAIICSDDFIAFAIASIVYNLPTSILGLMFPVLSGMEDGRKRAISRTIQLSLAITAPIALALTIYPSLPLSLLGQNYVQASNILTILILEAVASPIISGYTSYVYAIGNYIHVTMIGLATNVSRIMLYVILISTLEATGVAIAYTLGTIMALVAVLPSAKGLGYRFDWVQYAKTMTIPAILTIFLSTLNIHWLIGIPILLVVSSLAYARMSIVSKADLLEISQAFMSKERMSRMYVYARPLIKLIYGE